MSWLFIGAGNMASSLIGGLLKSGESAKRIAVVDPDESACQRSINEFGVHAATSVASVLDHFPNTTELALSGLVIAVKPHVVQAACESIQPCFVDTDTASNSYVPPLVISVAAGVRTTSMQRWLPTACPLIRCMPNTPALLGLGATALFANVHCSQEHKELASSLLDSAGMSLWVSTESELDAVTAISGSGPAYFFYLIEHMIEAGISLGLEREAARNLAIETAFGAASMARTRTLTPELLRENVTSKGGTTAAALAVFNQNETPKIISNAMQAAHDRAVELGNSQ